MRTSKYVARAKTEDEILLPPIGIRLNERDMERLGELAAADRRPISVMARFLLLDALEAAHERYQRENQPKARKAG